MAQQQMCWQQAQDYLASRNKGSKIHYSFGQSHYDPVSTTCYVQYETMEQFSENSLTYFVFVDDAFEGKTIAAFVGTSRKESDELGASYKEEIPTECHVNGKTCKERAVFNGMLWKLIPAFRPVNAVTVK